MRPKQNIHAGLATFGLLGAMALLACAAEPAATPRGPQPMAATPAPPAVAPIELDVPVVEPAPPLQHGLSKTGRRHNSNCRYWKVVVSPPEPAKQKNICKICGG